MKEPMLAATLENPEDIRFPVLVSPKLDGIRCVIVDGKPLTRKMKDIPNTWVRSKLEGLPPLDGEIICAGGFNATQSAVMRRDGQPDFIYHVFDLFSHPGAWFMKRLQAAHETVRDLRRPDYLRMVQHTVVDTVAEFMRLEEVFVEQGYEGIMLRSPEGPYKEGRSTLREGFLLKFKRFATDEGKIVGWEERLHNTNEKVRDERGKAKRSKAQAGLVGTGMLGAFIVQKVLGTSCWTQRIVTFGVGSGYTEEQRVEFWRDRERYAGKYLTYKHQPHGALEAPRFPVFVGFRDERDMS